MPDLIPLTLIFIIEMKLLINENKLKSAFFSYLDSMEELDVEMTSRYSDGDTLAYYPIANFGYGDDEDVDYEPVMESFVYYPRWEDYGWDEETYELKDFPLVELDNSIYNKIVLMFGETIFYTLAPEWFSNKIGKPVKNVYSQ